MQRSQCFAPGPLGNPLAWMCHVMLNGIFSSFNFQTYVDRVVPPVSFLDLKSPSCSPFLVFRPLEVDPMYFITFSSVNPGFEVTSALYTPFVRHLFSNGHKWALFFGQLQSLGFGLDHKNNKQEKYLKKRLYATYFTESKKITCFIIKVKMQFT